MEMHGKLERRFAVDLEHQDGFVFSGQASEDGRRHGSPFPSDEPEPVGKSSAPSTPALLAAAVGHCLSASLVEMLRRSHVEVLGCRTEAIAVVAPNNEGLPRIRRVEVTVTPDIGAPSPRTARCEELFEKYCTVTSSVREGVEVQVVVRWPSTERASIVAEG